MTHFMRVMLSVKLYCKLNRGESEPLCGRIGCYGPKCAKVLRVGFHLVCGDLGDGRREFSIIALERSRGNWDPLNQAKSFLDCRPGYNVWRVEGVARKVSVG